jgi:phenylacetate-coenzyme A ligase PaaK-like adenylate-forming protein
VWGGRMAARWTCGVGRDDVVHNAYGYCLFTGGSVSPRPRHRSHSHPPTRRNTVRQLQTMVDSGPRR